MSKKTVMKPVAVALGAAFVTSLAATSVASAAENPFGMTELSSGYMVAEEGKCGGKMQKSADEGKCGAKMKEKMKKEGKCGEAKCGAAMKKNMKEGKCGEGKCGANMKKGDHAGGDKMKEGKCGGKK